MRSNFHRIQALETGFTPTSEDMARKMMEIVRLQRDEVFYDLGSGDGTLLIMASKEFEARAIGVEIQDKLIEVSRRRIRDLGLDRRITVIKGDLFETAVADADVLGLYLTPHALRKLKMKLERALHKGTRIVVYRSPIEELETREVHRTGKGVAPNTIYLYSLQSMVPLVFCVDNRLRKKELLTSAPSSCYSQFTMVVKEEK